MFQKFSEKSYGFISLHLFFDKVERDQEPYQGLSELKFMKLCY